MNAPNMAFANVIASTVRLACQPLGIPTKQIQLFHDMVKFNFHFSKTWYIILAMLSKICYYLELYSNEIQILPVGLYFPGLISDIARLRKASRMALL